MEQNLQLLLASPLFAGIDSLQLSAMLPCLRPVTRSYSKNQLVISAGDSAESLGILLNGSLLTVKEDFWGNRNIVSPVSPGELFAEVYACLNGAKASVSVIALEPSQVMFFEGERIISGCSESCGAHWQLIKNLLSAIAEKTLKINEKLSHMAQRTTREKLLSYLSAQAIRQGDSSFTLPFNRQQLADYLSVDRSAMSAELSKMQADGLLEYNKNLFKLHSKL